MQFRPISQLYVIYIVMVNTAGGGKHVIGLANPPCQYKCIMSYSL